jgi:acid phosphatase
MVLMTSRLVWCWILMLVLQGCHRSDTAAPLAHEDLDAALWMRTSAEYRVLARDTFQRASLAVAEALKDPTWSALPDQASRLSASVGENQVALPPAVIVDVDETVLDTSAYQVRQILEQGQYQVDTWNQWVANAEASLVPGAKEFIQKCQQAGVAVFFVTNRDVEVERYTRRNLEQLGIIDPHAVDNILSKFERVEWTVDKTSRRDYVASRHRVLVVVGDDLNDFVWVGDKPTAAARIETADRYDEYWGESWYLLPNANYGNWERAIQGYDDTLAAEEKLKRKRQGLNSAMETKAP